MSSPRPRPPNSAQSLRPHSQGSVPRSRHGQRTRPLIQEFSQTWGTGLSRCSTSPGFRRKVPVSSKDVDAVCHSTKKAIKCKQLTSLQDSLDALKILHRDCGSASTAVLELNGVTGQQWGVKVPHSSLLGRHRLYKQRSRLATLLISGRQTLHELSAEHSAAFERTRELLDDLRMSIPVSFIELQEATAVLQSFHGHESPCDVEDIQDIQAMDSMQVLQHALKALKEGEQFVLGVKRRIQQAVSAKDLCALNRETSIQAWILDPNDKDVNVAKAMLKAAKDLSAQMRKACSAGIIDIPSLEQSLAEWVYLRPCTCGEGFDEAPKLAESVIEKFLTLQGKMANAIASENLDLIWETNSHWYFIPKPEGVEFVKSAAAAKMDELASHFEGMLEDSVISIPNVVQAIKRGEAVRYSLKFLGKSFFKVHASGLRHALVDLRHLLKKLEEIRRKLEEASAALYISGCKAYSRAAHKLRLQDEALDKAEALIEEDQWRTQLVHGLVTTKAAGSDMLNASLRKTPKPEFLNFAQSLGISDPMVSGLGMLGEEACRLCCSAARDFGSQKRVVFLHRLVERLKAVVSELPENEAADDSDGSHLRIQNAFKMGPSGVRRVIDPAFEHLEANFKEYGSSEVLALRRIEPDETKAHKFTYHLSSGVHIGEDLGNEGYEPLPWLPLDINGKWDDSGMTSRCPMSIYGCTWKGPIGRPFQRHFNSCEALYPRQPGGRKRARIGVALVWQHRPECTPTEFQLRVESPQGTRIGEAHTNSTNLAYNKDTRSRTMGFASSRDMALFRDERSKLESASSELEGLADMNVRQLVWLPQASADYIKCDEEGIPYGKYEVFLSRMSGPVVPCDVVIIIDGAPQQNLTHLVIPPYQDDLHVLSFTWPFPGEFSYPNLNPRSRGPGPWHSARTKWWRAFRFISMLKVLTPNWSVQTTQADLSKPKRSLKWATHLLEDAQALGSLDFGQVEEDGELEPIDVSASHSGLATREDGWCTIPVNADKIVLWPPPNELGLLPSLEISREALLESPEPVEVTFPPNPRMLRILMGEHENTSESSTSASFMISFGKARNTAPGYKPASGLLVEVIKDAGQKDVECENKSIGCMWKGPKNELAEHLLDCRRVLAIQKSLRKAGGHVGILQITLSWNSQVGNPTDLDLYLEHPCFDGAGCLFHGCRTCNLCRGMLDVDDQGKVLGGQSVENIFWPSDGEGLPPDGIYKVFVYNARGPAIPSEVLLKIGDLERLFKVEPLKLDHRVRVAEFEWPFKGKFIVPQDNIELRHKLEHKWHRAKNKARIFNSADAALFTTLQAAWQRNACLTELHEAQEEGSISRIVEAIHWGFQALAADDIQKVEDAIQALAQRETHDCVFCDDEGWCLVPPGVKKFKLHPLPGFGKKRKRKELLSKLASIEIHRFVPGVFTKYDVAGRIFTKQPGLSPKAEGDEKRLTLVNEE